MSKYFKLFSNCVLSKGINRSIICDLQKKQIYFIGNDFYNVINELKHIQFDDFIKEFDAESQENLDGYVQYFLAEGVAFFCNDYNEFPDLSLDFETPEIVNNAILDYALESNYSIKDTVLQLINLRCKFLEIRSYNAFDLNLLIEILELSEKTFLRNIDLLTVYVNEENYLNKLNEILINYPILGQINIHSSPYNDINTYKNLKFYTQKISDKKHCGIIENSYFSIDIKVFSESQKYNTCLNKKISIDVNGDIKNCPSISEKYGNIKTSSIKNVLKETSIKEYWALNKDQIDICKDCEFRHVCTDCRAYIEEPENKYSKPLKCGYSPYTNEWSEWSTNPLKQKGIEFYGMQDLVKKNE